MPVSFEKKILFAKKRSIRIESSDRLKRHLHMVKYGNIVHNVMIDNVRVYKDLCRWFRMMNFKRIAPGDLEEIEGLELSIWSFLI